MRPPGTSAQLEKRRRHAVQLLQSGKNLSTVARLVDASVSSVFRWQEAYRRHGRAGLRAKPTPGRPAGLSAGQKRTLVRWLLKGPQQAGYKTDLSTLQRVAALIDQHFGIQYHPGHVWKLLTASQAKLLNESLQEDQTTEVREGLSSEVDAQIPGSSVHCASTSPKVRFWRNHKTQAQNQ